MKLTIALRVSVVHAFLVGVSAAAAVAESPSANLNSKDIPLPFQNNTAELAPGENYRLQGNIVCDRSDRPHLRIDFDKHPILASRARRDYPYYAFVFDGGSSPDLRRAFLLACRRPDEKMSVNVVARMAVYCGPDVRGAAIQLIPLDRPMPVQEPGVPPVRSEQHNSL